MKALAVNLTDQSESDLNNNQLKADAVGLSVSQSRARVSLRKGKSKMM